tara:strand:+ start:562 stop:708 length:147 start_codon:yes stop_codon:yes gene_type:complete
MQMALGVWIHDLMRDVIGRIDIDRFAEVIFRVSINILDRPATHDVGNQ